MKQGIVVSGRNVTMYGNAANDWIATATAAHIQTQEEAESEVRKVGTGGYGVALRRALEKRGYTFSAEFDAELAAEAEETKKGYIAEARKRNICALRDVEATTAQRHLSTVCMFCEKQIRKNEMYRKLSKIRAHDSCFKEQQSAASPVS